MGQDVFPVATEKRHAAEKKRLWTFAIQGGKVSKVKNSSLTELPKFIFIFLFRVNVHEIRLDTSRRGEVKFLTAVHAWHERLRDACELEEEKRGRGGGREGGPRQQLFRLDIPQLGFWLFWHGGDLPTVYRPVAGGHD